MRVYVCMGREYLCVCVCVGYICVLTWYVCACIHVYLHVCVVCLCGGGHVSACVVCVCLLWYVWGGIHVCVCGVCLCVCMCLCACVSACMCGVCVCVRSIIVWLSLSLSSSPLPRSFFSFSQYRIAKRKLHLLGFVWREKPNGKN